MAGYVYQGDVPFMPEDYGKQKGRNYRALTVSLSDENLKEFDRRAHELGLTVGQLAKYMILTSLGLAKPPDLTVKKWIRGL